MTTLYIITKDAVHMHGVHGIFYDKVEAIKACKACTILDKDNHHEWQVVAIPANTLPEKEDIQGEGFNNIIFSTYKKTS